MRILGYEHRRDDAHINLYMKLVGERAQYWKRTPEHITAWWYLAGYTDARCGYSFGDNIAYSSADKFAQEAYNHGWVDGLGDRENAE